MANDSTNTISLMARGQTVSFDVVSKFLKVMPKEVLPKADFYAICEPLMSGFETTHSQVVRQIGLMYEDDNGYIHPRFNHEVSLSELSEYMQNCAEKYYVPNPYTQVTKSIAPLIEGPVNLYRYVKNILKSSKSQVNLQEVLANVFPNVIGNNSDKVITFLDTFTDISRDGELKNWFRPLNSDSKEIPYNYRDSKAYFDYLTPKSNFCIQQKNIMNNVYRTYITAIKSKPFLLLAGISGTGKSRIVRELARACWPVESEEYKAQKPKNFEMVQVKPNWHDSSELIGYVSRINGERFVVGPFLKFMVKAMQDPEHPYFLCLDEMNLAPVEQYFAEYLSVIESRKASDGVITTDPIIDYECTDAYHDLINQLFTEDDEERKQYLIKDGGKRLTIPQNLIVVGTVNMDETTFSFSRKVLDRAMTIEMNEVDLRGGLTKRYEPIGQQSIETLVGTAVEGVDVYESNQAVCDLCIDYLDKVNAQLEGTPFKVAYRTRNEVLLYVVNNLPYTKEEDGTERSQEYVIARALDEITNMKILSRIEGDESKVTADFLGKLKNTISEALTAVSSLRYADKAKSGAEEGIEDIEKSISLAKLTEMTKKLDSGYTSFWS